MNLKFKSFLLTVRAFFTRRILNRSNMYNLKRRRESVASVYRKTTKFLTANTASLLKKMPNTRKYNLLARIVEDNLVNNEELDKNDDEGSEGDDTSDLGERDLDYYLGVKEKETCWRDLAGREQIRKDYLLYHCGVTEEDYEKLYKKTVETKPYIAHPRLKQVPFKIHKKHKKTNSFREEVAESWVEKRGIFKLFGNRRDSETTSDSYSECDSNEEAKLSDTSNFDNEDIWNLTDDFNGCNIDALNKLMGVRIKEVSEGRPCDNCPELCPGFISHPWRAACLVRYQPHYGGFFCDAKNGGAYLLVTQFKR